jgi:hypothetical protein
MLLVLGFVSMSIRTWCPQPSRGCSAPVLLTTLSEVPQNVEVQAFVQKKLNRTGRICRKSALCLKERETAAIHGGRYSRSCPVKAAISESDWAKECLSEAICMSRSVSKVSE